MPFNNVFSHFSAILPIGNAVLCNFRQTEKACIRGRVAANVNIQCRNRRTKVRTKPRREIDFNSAISVRGDKD